MTWQKLVSFPATSLVAAVLVCMSCTTSVGYELSVENSGDTLISDVRVTFGQSRFLVGLLAPGSVKSFHDPAQKIPKVVVLEWRNSNGTLISVELDIAAKAGSDLSGEVVLEITGRDEVEVRVERVE